MTQNFELLQPPRDCYATNEMAWAFQIAALALHQSKVPADLWRAHREGHDTQFEQAKAGANRARMTLAVGYTVNDETCTYQCFVTLSWSNMLNTNEMRLACSNGRNWIAMCTNNNYAGAPRGMGAWLQKWLSVTNAEKMRRFKWTPAHEKKVHELIAKLVELYLTNNA